jgi:hypothetical protein
MIHSAQSEYAESLLSPLWGGDGVNATSLKEIPNS